MDRNLDFFGSFLTSGSTALRQKPEDPMNAVLKALANGPRPVAELLPVVGHSLSTLTEAEEALRKLGLIAPDASGAPAVTEQGRAVLAALT